MPRSGTGKRDGITHCTIRAFLLVSLHLDSSHSRPSIAATDVLGWIELSGSYWILRQASSLSKRWSTSTDGTSMQIGQLTARCWHGIFWRMRALPFYNTVEAYKVITYGTRPQHMLGLYYGVLIAILFITFIGMTIFVGVERIREDKAAKQANENEKNGSEWVLTVQAV